MKWNDYPNLAKRPHAPNEDRGRLQRQVRRALIVHGPLVSTSQLLGLIRVFVDDPLVGIT